MDAARFDNVPFEDEKFRIYYRPDVPLNGKNQIMPHWHEHIEFAYFTDGEALVLCDDKLIPAHAGDFFIINSNTVHGYRPGGGSPAHYHSFVLDALFFDQLNLDLIKYRFKTKISGDAEVDRYVKLIISELDKRLGDYRRIARYTMYALLLLLVRNYAETGDAPARSGSSKSEIVRQIIVHLHNNFEKTVTLTELSELTGYSADYISHVFKSLTGRTVISYLNEYRCQKARLFITSGDCNVSQAVSRCGFSNFSYFTRLYKKYFGVLPSDDLPK